MSVATTRLPVFGVCRAFELSCRIPFSRDARELRIAFLALSAESPRVSRHLVGGDGDLRRPRTGTVSNPAVFRS